MVSTRHRLPNQEDVEVSRTGAILSGNSIIRYVALYGHTEWRLANTTEEQEARAEWQRLKTYTPKYREQE